MSIEARLTHQFDGFALDVDLRAPDGVTAIMGPSGAGKTTVAKMIAGVMTPQSGRVQVGSEVLFDSAAGLQIRPHSRKIGYVFQEPRLLPHLSVRQNLLYGAWFAKRGSGGLAQIADMLGLARLLDRMPRGLSGGEAQRVALGRALLTEPRLLILDEPLAALDAARKDEILPYLARIRDQALCPILYISHSVSEVAQLADTLAVLDQGKLAALGPIAEVLADPMAAHGLGARSTGALLNGTVTSVATDGLAAVTVPAGTLHVALGDASVGDKVILRVESSDVLLSVTKPEGLSALNILPGRICRVTKGPSGSVTVQLEAAGDHVLAKLTQRSTDALNLAPGQQVYAIFKSVAVDSRIMG